MTANHSLAIEDLQINLTGSRTDVVEGVTLLLEPGQIMGLVGESGSGKTTVGLAVLGHARRGVEKVHGSVTIKGTSLDGLDVTGLRSARGELVSYVPQDPGTALNPALRIGNLIMELLEHHDYGDSAEERHNRVAEVLGEVLLPSDRDFQRRYPHQLSGGQQQRVGLAMAFACRPSVIVLDEPTTGLDVSTQVHVLDTVRSLARDHQVAGLYVTHDLAVVAEIADQVAVMYSGRVVETGPTQEIFNNPSHPYTRHLIAAAPVMDADRPLIGLDGRAPSPGQRPTGCFFSDRCEFADDQCRASFPDPVEVGTGQTVRCFHPFSIPGRVQTTTGAARDTVEVKSTPALTVENLSASYSGVEVVHNASFTVNPGECLALVGESGSGKSTLSRSLGGLHREWTGEVLLAGTKLAHSARGRSVGERLKIQYVFQNPYSSLHPRRKVGETVARPLMIGGSSEAKAQKAVIETLDQVSLPASFADQYPDQLSGGERQRVAIARGLVAQPDVLICDEVTSALDVLVQASIVELLIKLQDELGLAMLFVTHNLPLVRTLAHRVAVMSEGSIVELGPTNDIIEHPQMEYTRQLLADTPSIKQS